MDWFRLKHTVALYLIYSGTKRANYIKKHHLFHHVGDKCMFTFRKLPLYGDLISVGNNVRFASNVLLVTHDAIHNMLNNMDPTLKLPEYTGCIEMGDNVFVGANTTILYNSYIPSDTIIGAGSLVNRRLTSGGVWAGVPVRYICSIEEFLAKRGRDYLKIEKNGHRLSEKTIQAAWDAYHAQTETKSD